MYNCNISKSKLAFPLSNKIYLSVIASTALKLLRLKPEYFFLGHPVLLLLKQAVFASCFQVVIISLVSREENVRELMSSASSVVDIASIRNRFIYQELFKADLSDTMALPTDLSGLSHAYLQFLWNLYSSDPKFKKRTGSMLNAFIQQFI